jgi:DNA repair protein RadD
VQLRPYQREAVEAVYAYLRHHDDNPVVVIPTAGGKTPVMATICKDAVTRWDGRVLILAHIKELLEQAADKLGKVCPEVRFGIYSAGLKRRDKEHPVILAGIQSVYQRAGELDTFDLVLVDEAHLIPPEGDGMYRQFLAGARAVNPHLRVVGLTATPFRLKTGLICTPAAEGGILNAICYEIGVRELIRDGYLCPLTTKAGINKVDTSKLHVRGGEYVADEVEDLMDQQWLVEAACGELVAYTAGRRAVLIFASGVKHGQHVVQVLREKHGIECGFVTGDTPTGERDELLARFRGVLGGELFGRKPLKYLCNVNVLTTGFDAPNIDCVALLRPTLSAGLYYQMVGRGFRLHPGKANCLVLDFGGNVLRHGPVDQIKVKERDASGNGHAPAKECPECHSVIAAGYARCPDCGYEFPPPERGKHDAKASEAGILSGQVTTTKYAVRDVFYSVHKKRDAPDDAPRTMRVDYKVGWHDYKSEWVCFEHRGYARQKAVAWWKRRSPEPVPDTAQQAVDMAKNGGLAFTSSITVRMVAGDEFERITDYEIGPMPEPTSDGEEEVVSEDALDFPFGANAVAAEEEIPW